MGAETWKPDRSGCRTPGTEYGTEITSNKIVLTIELPVHLLVGITPAQSLDLTIRFHRALLPVMEFIFKRWWRHIAGVTLHDGSGKMPPRWEDL